MISAVQGLLHRWGPIATLALLASCEGSPAAVTPPPPDGGVLRSDSAPSPGPDYDLLYDPQRVVEVALEIAPEDLARIYADPFSREYVPATFVYDGQRVERVGVRIKGNLQINFMLAKKEHKFSFKVDFNRFVKGQTFCGLKKTNLHNVVNDPSFLRESTAYALLREGGVVASRAAYVFLHVNGEPYGVYTHVEQVDSAFFEHQLGSGGGNLYKPEGETLIFRGDDPAAYAWERFGVKQSDADPEHRRVIALMKLLSEPQRPSFTDDLEAIFDVDRLLRFLAINSFIINLDTYTPLGHNYYLYDDDASGKLVFIPWDMSEAFGNFACRPAEEMLELEIRTPYCGEHEGLDAPLFASVLAQPELMRRYLAILRELTAGGGLLAEESLIDRLVASHGRIADAVAADPLKHYAFEEFTANLHRSVPNQATDVSAAPPEILGLTDVVRQRSRSVKEQLAAP